MAIKAAIDVGSNSVKLLVADVDADGSYHVLLELSEVTALAKNLTPGGKLAPDNATRTLEILADFVAKAERLGATRIVAAGTSALRDAGDGAEFVQTAKDLLGLNISILSGEEEAELGRAVALRELPPGNPDVLFFDVGGGSTELTLLHSQSVVAQTSLQLGARRLTDAAGISQPLTPDALKAAERFIAHCFAEAPKCPAGVTPRIAGLGGTASTIVWMLAGQRGQAQADPNGVVVSMSELRQLQSDVSVLSLAELKQWPNLNPARAAVIYAGITIIVGLLSHYSADSFMLIDRGLRYGLLLADVE